MGEKKQNRNESTNELLKAIKKAKKLEKPFKLTRVQKKLIVDNIIKSINKD